jgi:hypothetical protein
MIEFNPMRELPARSGYGAGDVFVLFGELFGRGYANGIVEEARQAGMTIIGITVGRRDPDGGLRALTPEELAEAERNLGGKIINIPMEAGFDMEPGAGGKSPVDQLKGVKSDEWENFRLDWEAVETSRSAGVARFKSNLAAVVSELDKLIPAGSNILFTHTMAGGIPRTRIFMPILNRVFKGQGDRYLPSEAFWKSDLGRLCGISFDEVTADTFSHLIDATASIREKGESAGKRVRYVAYGYHGCEVLIGGNYTWQSYTPYLQGWAKMRLERIAAAARSNGVNATIFNCPEIQTNSSALFLGVEISLYPLLAALEREGGGPRAGEIAKGCAALLGDNCSIAGLLSLAESYLSSPVLSGFREFSEWPRHNTREQAEFMLQKATELLAMNRDPKEIVCAELSREVFKTVGALMFDTSWNSSAPVYWLGHDIIAKRIVNERK